MLVNLWKMTKFAGHYRSRLTSDENTNPVVGAKNLQIK